jgi:hypothetical protein
MLPVTQTEYVHIINLNKKNRGQDGNRKKIENVLLLVSVYKYALFSQKFHSIISENMRPSN